MAETAGRSPATQGRWPCLGESELSRIVGTSAWDAFRNFPARQPDDPPLVFGNVPPRNPNFTGRDELLDQLTKRLRNGTTALLPSALHGLGGTGKTQMVTEYIYRHLQDYDLVWWIDAAHTTQIRPALSELSGVRAFQGASVASVAVPRNGPGEILITSRNSDWAGIARPLELAVFKREESVELLGRRGLEIDPDDADELAEKLGDLPLAVEQAAAWRAVTGMPVQEYLRLFDESVEEILDTASAPDNEVSVAAAWNVSFEELKTRNPAAHQILHICAFFSPEPISRDLLTGVSRVSISPELDAALRDPIKLARAIRDINRYGLEKIDHGNNTLQLHRLVHAAYQHAISLRLAGAYLEAARLDQEALNRRIEVLCRDHVRTVGVNSALIVDLREAGEYGQARVQQERLTENFYARFGADQLDATGNTFMLSITRRKDGDHSGALSLSTEALKRFRFAYGDDHATTMACALAHSIDLRHSGDLAAAKKLGEITFERYQGGLGEHHPNTLALRLQVSGEENEETLALQRNITIDLRAQGDFAAATKLSEEIYDKAKRMFGEDDRKIRKRVVPRLL